MQIILLYAEKVDFTNQQTGEVVSGTRLQYAFPERVKEEDMEGYPLFKEWLADVREFGQCVQVPGVYEARTVRTPGKDGKPVERIKGIQYVGPVELVIGEAVKK